jgi:hypothetical protein
LSECINKTIGSVWTLGLCKKKRKNVQKWESKYTDMGVPGENPRPVPSHWQA